MEQILTVEEGVESTELLHDEETGGDRNATTVAGRLQHDSEPLCDRGVLLLEGVADVRGELDRLELEFDLLRAGALVDLLQSVASAVLAANDDVEAG